jgi:hypothetical protein
LSLLLAILAAAHIELILGHRRARSMLTIILDRGITMSARGSKELRFREIADQVQQELRRRFTDCTIQLISVPGETTENLDLMQFSDRVAQLGPTALDTRQLLSQIVSQAKPPTVVISDRALPGDSQVIQAAPEGPIEDVAITAIAARERPSRQVMVRIRNQSPRASVALRISSAGQSLERQIDLPMPPGERNYFVDLPAIGGDVRAELPLDDALPANNRAWLVRERASPKIEPRFPVSPELRRLIEAYARSRPAGRESATLSIVNYLVALHKGHPGILIAPAQETVVRLDLQVSDHALTGHVNWQKLPAPLRVASAAPDGWWPLLRTGQKILLAVSPSSNQVWIGFDSATWTTSTDYVIFWTNVFDWAGGGAESLSAHSIDQLTPSWKPVDSDTPSYFPGLYQRNDGSIRAFNAPDVPIPNGRSIDRRSRIAALAAESARADLSPWLLILAITAVLASALLWKRAIVQSLPNPAVPPDRELRRR